MAGTSVFLHLFIAFILMSPILHLFMSLHYYSARKRSGGSHGLSMKKVLKQRKKGKGRTNQAQAPAQVQETLLCLSSTSLPKKKTDRVWILRVRRRDMQGSEKERGEGLSGRGSESGGG